jgi:predicted anti-sigma-YlaC factor YlaD
MYCTQYREALSARLDGEPLGVSDEQLDRHLHTCAGCTAWSAAATRATRLVRLGTAPDVPDLSARILAAAGVTGSGVTGSGVTGSGAPAPARDVRSQRWRGRLLALVRVALAGVAAVQAAIGWPALALGMDSMQAPMHVAHESGAWNVALAVALLAVARRPRYATGLLPLLAAFVVVLTVVSLPDVVAGYVPIGRIAGHLLLVGALGLVAALAHQVRQPETPLGGLGAAPGWGSGDRPGEPDRSPTDPHRRPAFGESHYRGMVGDEAPDRVPARRVVA